MIGRRRGRLSRGCALLPGASSRRLLVGANSPQIAQFGTTAMATLDARQSATGDRRPVTGIGVESISGGTNALSRSPRRAFRRSPRELRRKRPPRNVVDREIMQRFEEFAVVAALVAAARPGRLEHPKNNRQILDAHPCQHRRPPVSRPPMSQRFADLGFPSLSSAANPSTRSSDAA